MSAAFSFLISGFAGITACCCCGKLISVSGKITAVFSGFTSVFGTSAFGLVDLTDFGLTLSPPATEYLKILTRFSKYLYILESILSLPFNEYPLSLISLCLSLALSLM